MLAASKASSCSSTWSKTQFKKNAIKRKSRFLNNSLFTTMNLSAKSFLTLTSWLPLTAYFIPMASETWPHFF